jgi:hypothetical protein
MAFDCPNCGLDRSPCFTEEQMRTAAEAGDAACKAALFNHLARPTEELVDRFAEALKAKLRASEAKYGWRNGWIKPDWESNCQRELARHVGKGDPLDVAAYAAFCWHHGWLTASPLPPQSSASGGHSPHVFEKHKKYLFCSICGYSQSDRLMHPASWSAEQQLAGPISTVHPANTSGHE